MPLVDLCVYGSINSNEQFEHDFVMKTIVGRGLGPDSNHTDVMNILNDENQVVLLIFPHPYAMDLEQGIKLAERQCGFTLEDDASFDKSENKKMNLLFIDATWKHAREMEAKLTKALDSEHWIRIQLIPEEITPIESIEEISNSQDETSQTPFVQRRFQIRAPPSPNHLSTAECLAWVASRVERNPIIYESITKVLDYMVNLWRVNVASNNKSKVAMSQKQLSIKHNLV